MGCKSFHGISSSLSKVVYTWLTLKLRKDNFDFDLFLSTFLKHSHRLGHNCRFGEEYVCVCERERETDRQTDKLPCWVSFTWVITGSYTIILKIYLFIYWKVRYTERRREREEDIPFDDSLPK